MPPLLEFILLLELVALVILGGLAAAGMPLAKRFWPLFLKDIALTSSDDKRATATSRPSAPTMLQQAKAASATKKPSAPVQLVVVVRDGMPADRIAGFAAGTLQVDTMSPADAGPTNKVLLELLAAGLGVPQNAVGLIKGHYQARKTIQISGLSLEEIQDRIGSPRT